jgi:hypothetical protein
MIMVCEWWERRLHDAIEVMLSEYEATIRAGAGSLGRLERAPG